MRIATVGELMDALQAYTASGALSRDTPLKHTIQEVQGRQVLPTEEYDSAVLGIRCAHPEHPEHHAAVLTLYRERP